jgi:RND family efflux transporter MFP subunit
VSGLREATLICVTGGRVSTIDAREGQYVKEGQSLGKIDAEKAKTTLETAKLNERIALANYERTRKHLENGNASQLQVDQLHLAYLSAKQQRIDAEKVYEGAYCISPMNGWVVDILIERDQQCAPGTPTFSVAQLGKMKVEIGIPESDIASISQGNSAEVTIDTHPGRNWKGRVTAVSRKVNPRTKKFSADIVIDNRDRALLSGVTARVRLAVRRMEEQIVVPTSSIRIEGNEKFVMVASGKNTASKRVITTGLSDRTSTVVVRGLDAGEQLITAGQHLVSQGSPITISE